MIISNIFWRVIAWFATFGMFVYGAFSGFNGGDFIGLYEANVKSVDYYCNDFYDAVPQTEIFNIVSDHFFSPLADGKTVKKAIVIGYDGCRADVLSQIDEEHPSAIKTLAEDSGSVLLSYCGGVNYPRINVQATSTAPGWCSMLTGVWATEHGVDENYSPKSEEYPTLLLSLVESGAAASSAFYVSWGGHFTENGATYINEKNYAESKGLPVTFRQAGDDNGTFANVMSDVASPDCSDFIFSIFEYCDHYGHSNGFCIRNGFYTEGFFAAEKTGSDIIEAIKARPTYDTEDWLIIITSDHGGYNVEHGGTTMQERYTFIAANKDLTGYISSSPIC